MRSLTLSQTGVGDAALANLRGLKNLERLDLNQTRITDAGLKILASLKKLASLDISQTEVSERGARDLQQALPGWKAVSSLAVVEQTQGATALGSAKE